MKKAILFFGAFAFIIILAAFNLQNDPWDIPEKYQKMENPYASAGGDCLDYGEELFEKHCVSCHGSEGFGDGKKAGDLDTPMPDLTSDEYKEQAPGVKYYQSFIGRKDMPNFEKKIPDEEDRWCIINYMDKL